MPESNLQEVFALKGKDIVIIFSGAKGLHALSFDPTIRDIGSPERREIVNYLIDLIDRNYIKYTDVSASTNIHLRRPRMKGSIREYSRERLRWKKRPPYIGTCLASVLTDTPKEMIRKALQEMI
jgi:DNA primase catalytic subunit